MQDQAKTLFQLQSELVEVKIDMSVSKSITQVVEQIVNLKHEVHRDFAGLKFEVHREIASLKDEMKRDISGLKEDMSSVKTRLGMRNQVHGEVRTRFFDYSFKAGWLIGLAVLYGIASYVIMHFHSLIT
jgi:hypothetical protein